MGLTHEVGHGTVRATAPPPGTAPPPPSSPASPIGTFHIDIGELVLDGFDARAVDPDRVSAAFRAELTRLVRERGVPLAARSDGAGVALDGVAGLPPLPPTTHPVRLGEALARAVHAGLAGRGEAR
ncbi:hypothetical protein [Streptomyces catenulae]|uniref:Uncharacterized protein n=1 Tax=Streptomyces catenulae TaxID=66875 RepID=A0ABV2YSR0_9ACTN|nr:hypothetical protein [Streptomyces catenulae]